MRSDHPTVIPHLLPLLLLLAAPPSARWWPGGAAAVGVNWGRSSSTHPLPPSAVVQWLLQANNVTRVRLPDADPDALQSLAGTGIGVTVGIPNEMLQDLNSSKTAAASWVHDNVTRYIAGATGGGGGGVRIEYVAVGDDLFQLNYGQKFLPFVVGAATNIQLALVSAKLAAKVKVIFPCSTDAYQSDSSKPSKGHFRPDLNKTIVEILSFLTKYDAPFMVDINPFLSFQLNKNLSLDFVTFQTSSHPVTDGHNKYYNYFDMTIDTLVSSLSTIGHSDMDIVVGKIGWPTDGAMNATPAIAETFMQGFVDHVKGRAGTPLKPKWLPSETYMFSLLDEDQRSITLGNFERHWGIFTSDGQAKYHVDLGQGSKALVNAHDVEYLANRWCVVDNNKDLSNVSAAVSDACSNADCTALSPGGSCSEIGWPGNVSYALNSYFQQHDQTADSCDFRGLGLITTVDPSVRDCRFTIAPRTSFSTSIHRKSFVCLNILMNAIIYVSLLFFSWS